MTKVPKPKGYRHAENISWRRVGAEAVLLDLDTSAYYSLNEVGIIVWERLGAGDGVEAIAAAVCKQYDAREPEVRKHVEGLIADLVAKGLLHAA